MTATRWMIWNFERGMWWKPHRNGYTPYPREAGTYSFEEASEIVNAANEHVRVYPEEAMLPVPKNLEKYFSTPTQTQNAKE